LLCSDAAKDYNRIGRSDIAQLLIQLTIPAKNYISVFEKAKKEYTQNPDYNWGYVLSLCLEHGFGTEIDKRAAFAIDQRFAEQNHPLALCSVARDYFDANTSELAGQAIQFYRKATEPEQQSFYLAHALWGNRLLEGNDGEKNEIEGLAFLQKADEKGCGFATECLISYSLQKLSEKLRSAAEMQGISEADAARASAELKEIQEKTYFYSKRGNERGLAIGKFTLAQCYYYGYGVVQSVQQHLKLLKECVAMSLPIAIETLARYYQYGFEGALESNTIQSLILYFKILRAGQSLNSLEDFQKLITDNKTNLEFVTTAYDLCNKCLQGHLLGNELDSFVMGFFYQHGILVQKNIETAILCFQKGADLGNCEAATTLIKLSLDPENAQLIPIALARKYFSYADNEEISEVRLHYNAHYLPLLQNLKRTWPTLGVNMPDGITELIAAYADTPSTKQGPEQAQEQEKEQKQEQETSSLIVYSSLRLPTQAEMQEYAIESGIPLRFPDSAGVPASSPLLILSSSTPISSESSSDPLPPASSTSSAGVDHVTDVIVHVSEESLRTANSTI